MSFDLSIIYYTSNWLDEKNPYFLKNCQNQLLKVIGDMPLVYVGQKSYVSKLKMRSGINIAFLDMGRSHLNIYRQMLAGVKAAKTKYVAMAEDDILYSYSHFHSSQIEKEFKNHGDVFLYDMNKVSIFTWTKPPMFSFRSKRMVINQLIVPRQLFIEAIEERFVRLEVLLKTKTEAQVIKYWGDPGRYESLLGVTVRPTVQFYSQTPSIVFSHEEAYGYLNQGKKKRIGDIKITELYDWGRAEDILKLYYEPKTI